MLTFASCFSGIGGPDLGFERAGFRVVRHCEKDQWKSQVLKRHWPGAEHFTDIADLSWLFRPIQQQGRGGDNDEPWEQLRDVNGKIARADIEWGSPPCQDLSIAGKRAGLAGGRSGLFYKWMDYIEASPPREFAVMEQVPGLFSSNDGQDFADVLGAFTGWTPPIPQGGWRSGGVCFGPKRQAAWRVLNSRYFGLAQRRARVFFIVDFRGQRAAEVLFEPESGDGYFAPIGCAGDRPSGATVSGTLNSSGAGTSRPAGQANEKDFCVVTGTIQARDYKGIGNQDFARLDEQFFIEPIRQTPNTDGVPNPTGVPEGLVRSADSKIYQACGDAVSVNVAEWIAKRIMLVLGKESV